MFEPGASGSSELGGPVAGTTSGARTASTDGRTGGNHRPATNIPHASPQSRESEISGGTAERSEARGGRLGECACGTLQSEVVARGRTGAA